jgi:DNA polymerase III epsilon subunit-like protein
MTIVLVFDTETTGLPKSKQINPLMFHLWPYIVQFSYIMYDTQSHRILKKKDSIIKIPSNIIISEESVNIHKITNEMCEQSGIELSSVLESFFEDIKKSDMVIGHNVQFDLNMVKIELLRLIENDSLPNKKIRLYKDILYQVTYVTLFRCSMEETKDYCNILIKSKKGNNMYVKFPSLLELHQKLFNTTPQHLHNSLHDVIVTLRCFIEFNYKADVINMCDEIRDIVATLGIV